ncbi:MAG: hypothetical protein U1A78_25510 [Polyangia bacterium]
MPTRKTLTIRMYNVGFGDCFLIEIPAPKQPRRILIDCGSHKKGHGPRPMKQVIEQLITHLKDKDGDEHARPHLDVLIVTHRHEDHISGFAETELWKKVTVDEIWMPWTENPHDAEAMRLRKQQKQRALELMGYLETLSEAEEPYLLAARALVQNSSWNDKPMDMLYNGFSSRSGSKPLMRYLPDKKATPSFTTDALPGVSVHVLGPPRDPAMLRERDPPLKRRYLQLDAAAPADGQAPDTGADAGADEGAETEDTRPPFADRFVLPWQPGQELPPAMGHLGLSAATLALLGESDRAGGALAEAAELEANLNATSLMLMLEIGQAFLLCPGDQQWVAWQKVLDDEHGSELLRRTTFYKVGHHGSFNATPRDFVEELLGEHVYALVPTQNRGGKPWKEIPKLPLLEGLREKHAYVIRSDQAEPGEPRSVHREGDEYVEVHLPY